MKYYILDTETTGLRAGYHEIIEISMIDFDSKTQLFEKIKASYPERASLDALKITGKSIFDLSYGSSKEDVANKINHFLNRDGLSPSHRCIVAHNASFDMRFCHAFFQSLCMDFPADYWLDTISMFKKYCQKENIQSANNLNAACNTLNIVKTGAAHNAKHDTRNAFYLFKKLHGVVDHLPFIKHKPCKSNAMSDDEMKEILESVNYEEY